MAGSTVRPREPWARVTHPAFLVALLLLVANDRLFETEWPGAVTGKLSDAAGLFLLGAIGFDLVERVAGCRGSRSHVRLAVASLVAMPFVAVNTNRHVAGAVRDGAGRMLDALGAVLGWAPVVPADGSRVVAVSDPTDLLVLPAVFLPLLLVAGRPRIERPTSRSVREILR